MTTFDVDLLRAHDRFVRDLARSLVRDRAAAEDLAQDAWLAALRHGGGRIRNLRGWLRATIEHGAHLLHRRDVRRRRREGVAVGALESPATAALVERLHDQRELLDAVEALAEPYRTTILLRFFEGLPPRRIAARLAVPVETVRTRLQRALQRLRESLDARFGSRAMWSLPLQRWLEFPASSSLPAVVMAMHAHKLLVAFFLLLSGALGLWWLGARDTAPSRTSSVAEGPSLGAVRANAPSPAVGDAAAPAERVAVGPPVVAPVQDRSVAGRSIHGRVLTVDARPLPGVPVVHRGAAAAARAVTAPDGTFELPIGGSDDELVVADPAWRTVLHGEPVGGLEQERVLIVGPALPVDGRVLDAEGLPIAGARVWWRLPADLRSRFAFDLTCSGDEYVSGMTAADGAFRLADCARVGGASLEVAHDGFRPASVALDGVTIGLRVVLQRPQLRDGAWLGQVVDERDRPVADAHVSGGRQATRSDARGEFVLAADAVTSFARIAAAKPGMMPAFVPLPAAPTYLRIRLRAAALTLGGTVVDANGTPLVGAKVWVSDASFFGAADGFDSCCEGIAAGQAVPSRAAEPLADLSPAELSRRAQPTPLWPFVRSDASGHFRIHGLAERAYRLRVQAPETLQTVELGPFAAGSDGLRLALPANGVFARITGQVVDGDGRPVPGARVDVRVRLLALPVDARTTTYRNELRDEAICDDAGRFELARIPKTAMFAVQGDGIEPTGFGGEDADDLPIHVFATGPFDDGHLDVRLPCVQRCTVRIELLGDLARADEARLLLADGTPARLLRIEGRNHNDESTIRLHAGRSAGITAPATATTLVVCEQGRELRRLPILLRAGRDNVLRF